MTTKSNSSIFEYLFFKTLKFLLPITQTTKKNPLETPKVLLMIGWFIRLRFITTVVWYCIIRINSHNNSHSTHNNTHTHKPYPTLILICLIILSQPEFVNETQAPVPDSEPQIVGETKLTQAPSKRKAKAATKSWETEEVLALA